MSDFIDPDSAASIASIALDRSLVTLRQALTAASDAASSATAAAATRTAIATMLQAVGVAHQWQGTALQIKLPDGSYGPLIDLKGKTGDPGETPNLQVGTVESGSVPTVEIIGSDPRTKLINFVLPRGLPGLSGWTPLLALVQDGQRIVQQVVDWFGGTGQKPTSGLFIGPSGLVGSVTAAKDIRGLAGSVADTGSTPAGHLAVWTAAHTIGDGGALSGFGRSLVASISAAAVKTLLAIGVADVAGAQPALGYTAENIAAKSQPNGYAGLDGTGKVPLGQLPASVAGAFNFVAIWDASANSPILASGTGTKGALYKVGTAGTTTLDGISQWNVGDSAVFDGTHWGKIDGIANEVITVAGLFGNITAAALKVALNLSISDIAGAATAASVADVRSNLSGRALFLSMMG